MGRAYSQDLRERVMAAVDSGAGAYAAASIFRVSVSYIYKLLDRRKRTAVVVNGCRKGVGLGRCFQSIRRQAARIASP
jgi:transposase